MTGHVLIADDNAMFRDTLKSHLERHGGFQVEAVADLPQALAVIQASGPFDIVLLDYTMPGMNGLGGLKQAVEASGGRPVALMSGFVTEQVHDQLSGHGAVGFLAKTQIASSGIADIRDMIARPRAPVPPPLPPQLPEEGSNAVLSARDRQVLAGLCAGLEIDAVARQLDLRDATVKLHVKMICSKLAARDAAHAVAIARDAGLC